MSLLTLVCVWLVKSQPSNSYPAIQRYFLGRVKVTSTGKWGPSACTSIEGAYTCKQHPQCVSTGAFCLRASVRAGFRASVFLGMEYCCYVAVHRNTHWECPQPIPRFPNSTFNFEGTSHCCCIAALRCHTGTPLRSVCPSCRLFTQALQQLQQWEDDTWQFEMAANLPPRLPAWLSHR